VRARARGSDDDDDDDDEVDDDDDDDDDYEVDDDDDVDDDYEVDDDYDDDEVKAKRKTDFATKIRWCECGKQITSQLRFHPEIDGDDRSGKPCCEGCYRKAHAKKMNEKCVVCKKKITGRIRRHPKIEGDDKSGEPCCEGCYTKALDKAIKAKNLKLRNFCERCVALRRKEVGGRYARKCEITSEVYWRCFECQRRGVQNRYRNEKRKREGLGPPRKFTRRKLSWIL